MNPFKYFYLILIIALIIGSYYHVKTNLRDIPIKYSSVPYEVTVIEMDEQTITCGRKEEKYYGTTLTTPRLFGFPLSVKRETITRSCE